MPTRPRAPARRTASRATPSPFGGARRGSLKWWISVAGVALAMVGTYCTQFPGGRPGSAPAPAGVAFAGLPQGRDVQVLENDGFTVGFSPAEKVPLWVVYRATDPRSGPTLPRPESFARDPRAPESADSDDYTGTGYDRGHMAPNSIVARLYGATAQRETFLTTNIAPQTPRLNQLAWQRLEEAEANQLAPRLGPVWVTLGPVIGPEDPALGRSRVRVPGAFYRIWLARDEAQGTLSALAFILPQAVRGNEDLTQFVVSVDEIEARTGLDFFAGLDDATERALEASRATADGPWQLARFARSSGRYAGSYRDRPGAALGNGRFAPKTGRNPRGVDAAPADPDES